MKEWGVQIASERSLRKRASTLITNDFVAENAMFSFSLKSGGDELQPAPIVYVPHLKDKIFTLLDKNNQ